MAHLHLLSIGILVSNRNRFRDVWASELGIKLQKCGGFFATRAHVNGKLPTAFRKVRVTTQMKNIISASSNPQIVELLREITWIDMLHEGPGNSSFGTYSENDWRWDQLLFVSNMNVTVRVDVWFSSIPATTSFAHASKLHLLVIRPACIFSFNKRIGNIQPGDIFSDLGRKRMELDFLKLANDAFQSLFIFITSSELVLLCRLAFAFWVIVQYNLLRFWR